MDKEIRNFRWAYKLLLVLAKDELEKANKEVEGTDYWPAGQDWDDLVGTSKSIFLRRARARAGINDDEFLEQVRDGSYDISDLDYCNAQRQKCAGMPALRSDEIT